MACKLASNWMRLHLVGIACPERRRQCIRTRNDRNRYSSSVRSELKHMSRTLKRISNPLRAFWPNKMPQKITML